MHVATGFFCIGRVLEPTEMLREVRKGTLTRQFCVTTSSSSDTSVAPHKS